MKGWCVIPERMNARDFVQALSPYTNLSLGTMNVEYFRNFSRETQTFNVRVLTTFDALDYFSRQRCMYQHS